MYNYESTTLITNDVYFYPDSSKNAVFDNKKGIRGGVPIVFRKSATPKYHLYCDPAIAVGFSV